jgi:hypothetical protein
MEVRMHALRAINAQMAIFAKQAIRVTLKMIAPEITILVTHRIHAVQKVGRIPARRTIIVQKSIRALQTVVHTTTFAMPRTIAQQTLACILIRPVIIHKTPVANIIRFLCGGLPDEIGHFAGVRVWQPASLSAYACR